MKKIEKEAITKDIVTTYEAYDGRIFDKKEDCEKWEKSYECTITNCFNKIPQISITPENACMGVSYDDDKIIALIPRDFEDIKIINAYVEMATYKCTNLELTHENINHVIFLNFGDERIYCFYKDMNTHLEYIRKTYEEYENKLRERMNTNN